jgi:hypothetical protein
MHKKAPGQRLDDDGVQRHLYEMHGLPLDEQMFVSARR